MKYRFIFMMLLCASVNTFVMCMDNPKQIDRDKKKAINYALFKLDDGKRIKNYRAEGALYHFFDGEKFEINNKEDIFSCLILSDDDMWALQGGFKMLDENNAHKSEFFLPDRPIYTKIALNASGSEKEYILEFKKAEKTQEGITLLLGD